MRQSLTCISFAILLTCVAFGANGQTQPSDRLTVARTDSAYVLSVPASRLQMVLPDANLVQQSQDIGGSTSNPRYYYFSDPKRRLVLSGWFEPASRFAGISSFWESELAAWKKQQLPNPQNVVITNVGSWQAIFYDLAVPNGTNLHVRAHLVQAGTWIDLHISLFGDPSAPPNRSTLKDMLNRITVTEKPGS